MGSADRVAGNAIIPYPGELYWCMVEAEGGDYWPSRDIRRVERATSCCVISARVLVVVSVGCDGGCL